MTPADLSAIRLTLELAATSTLLLIAIGTPLAWALARSRAAWKPLVAALVALPLVLPPTVLGFYLLLLLGPQGPLGPLRLPFTFGGLVLGSVLYSLPFVVQPLQQAFEAIPERVLEAAATLRAGPLDRFLSIALPLARPGFITAGVLGFAHTVGEFGVVLMIGGNIPGSTRVLSIALYDHVEAGDYASAHRLAAGLMLFALTVLLGLQWLTRKRPVSDAAGGRSDKPYSGAPK